MRCSIEFISMMSLIVIILITLIISMIVNGIYSKISYSIMGILLTGAVAFTITSAVLSSQPYDFYTEIYSLNLDQNSKFKIEFHDTDGWYATVLVKDSKQNLIKKNIDLGGSVHFIYSDELSPSISNHIHAWTWSMDTILTLPNDPNIEWVINN